MVITESLDTKTNKVNRKTKNVTGSILYIHCTHYNNSFRTFFIKYYSSLFMISGSQYISTKTENDTQNSRNNVFF